MALFKMYCNNPEHPHDCECDWRPSKQRFALRLDGWVYVIGNIEHGWFKIGYSRVSPESRLEQIKGNCPVPLKIIARMEHKQAYLIEQMLHGRFAKKRLQGEWFQLTLDEIRSIEVPSEE